MGTHKGWRVRQLAKGKKRWLAEAWDPQSQRYRGKMHATAAGARAWGKDEHARFRAGLDSAEGTTATGVDALLPDYYADLERRCVPGHVENVRRALKSFAAAVPDLEHPRAKVHAQAWIDEAIAEELAAATIAKRLRCARALVAWAMKHERLKQDPLRLVTCPKIPKTDKAQFTIDELRTIARAVDDPFHLRACLMLYGGLRSAEAHHCYWGEIPAKLPLATAIQWPEVLLVRGKGKKDRLVPLQPELKVILAARGIQQQGPVHPGHLSPYYVRNGSHLRAFRAFLGRLGIPVAGRTPHSLRHCYAGLMSASMVPSQLLGRLMGHEDQDTLSGYTGLAVRYSMALPQLGWAPGIFAFFDAWITPWRSPWPRP